MQKAYFNVFEQFPFLGKLQPPFILDAITGEDFEPMVAVGVYIYQQFWNIYLLL